MRGEGDPEVYFDIWLAQKLQKSRGYFSISTHVDAKFLLSKIKLNQVVLHQSQGGAKRCKMFKIVVICRKKMGKAKKGHIFASLVMGWSESASSDLSLTTRSTGATHQF